MTSQSSRRPLPRLAATAVAALIGVGLLPATAQAAPVADGFDGQSVVLSPRASTYTVGEDGTDQTVRLAAGADPTVSRVRFDYQVRDQQFGQGEFGQWMPIQTVTRNDDGLFAIEWEGAGDPVNPLATRTVNVRAVPVTASGQQVSGITVTPKTGLTETTERGVNLTNGSALGYFAQPYESIEKISRLISLSGTTGPTGATVNDPRNRTLRLQYFAEGATLSTSKPTEVTSVPAGAFTESLDISEFEITAGAGAVNQLAVLAELRNGSSVQADETEAYSLYQQTITTVTATPDRTNVAPGEAARVTVTVLDQAGEPVVGAQVMSSVVVTPAQDPAFEGYTGPDGTLDVNQDGGTTAFYYANGDDSAAFSSASSSKDRKSGNVTIVSYQATPTSLAATSADGSAFDLDEVDNAPSTGTGNDGDATDVTVQVKDQRGADMSAGASQVMEYFWTVTPFSGGVATRFPATGTSTGSPEGNGKFSVVVPAGGNGTYELFAGLTRDNITTEGAIASSKVLTVKAGQAAITWDRTSPQEAPAGATSQVTGRLALPDGTGLPGRDLALTFQRDTNTADEDPTPDAGFSVNGGVATTTTVTAAAGGAFSVSVTDPAESPQLQELGDNIDASSATNSFGNAGATRNDQVVNFVVDTTPTALSLTESRESATLRPGEFTLYTVRVTNRLGGGVGGQDVRLTTDGGYFSQDDGSAVTTSPTQAPSPVAGADAGTFRNDGTSITVRTGAEGTATVFLAMGRNAGFDDDGLLTTRVTATSGALSATDNHSWTSANPLNGGAVELVVSDKAQDSAILPKAQSSDQVFVDVLVTDQFGNAVGGENVSLTDDSAGTITESDGTANDGTVVSDFAKEGDATLASATGTAQKVTASWTTERVTYTGASTTTAPGTETLTDDYTVEWYAVDYAASDITFTPNGTGAREVGSSVTLTYEALDQLGQPISDLFIAFTRSGPGAGSDTSGSSNTLTGADGTATYTFVGSVAGRADVTANARQGSATGDAVSAASRTASVTFEEEQVDPVKPQIETVKKIRGNKLVLKVAVTASTQDPVQGTLVLTENGKRLLTRELNADGERKLVVRGLKKGFHSVRLTFQGNDLVRERSKTFTFTIR